MHKIYFMKKLLFLSIASIFALSSCIKEPVACIQTSSNNVELWEDVTFTSCSEDAESLVWEVDNAIDFFSFFGGATTEYTTESATQNWSVPGTYGVSLTAYSKKEKEKNETSDEVVVVDICYTCTNSSGYSFDHCAYANSFASTLAEFEAEIADYESQGYTCVKK